MRFNADVSGEIIRADSQGASPEEMKELYIRRSALNVELDIPIYRILTLQYFLEDLCAQCLSHTKIDGISWGDSAENPLLGREFDDTDGARLTLDAVVDRFYGSCWSATALGSNQEWEKFSRLRPCVRLQSTPRKLLNSVMSKENTYYMLHHYIGRILYVSYDEAEKYFYDSNWPKHLDSLGHGIAASLLMLDESLSEEDEIRLLYDHASDPWHQDNVQISGRFAKVPFDWSTAIDDVVVGPFESRKAEATLRSALLGLKIDLRVSPDLGREGG